MEWATLCDYHGAIRETLEATGYRRVEPLSCFWEKDDGWAHLTLHGEDGLRLAIDGHVRIRVNRR